MMLWIISAVAGTGMAVLLYGWRDPRGVLRTVPLIALRAVALTMLVALVLDAPAGPRRPGAPLVALDASLSWQRGRDSLSWRRAVRAARAASRDSVLLFGDSVRRAPIPSRPSDRAT